MATIVKLASDLAKREGKKKEARIGEIRELLKILASMEVEFQQTKELYSPFEALDDYASKIAAKKKTKKVTK